MVALVARSVLNCILEFVLPHFCDESDEEAAEVVETLGEGGSVVIKEGTEREPILALVSLVWVMLEPKKSTSERWEGGSGRGWGGGG